MESINVTKKQFEKLALVDIPKCVNNSEAKIFCIKRKGEVKVFKNLHRLKGATFANKLYTLEMLGNNKEILPEEFVIPDYLITIDSMINGFAMPFIKGTNLKVLLSNPKIDNSVKIGYLKQIGHLLEKLKYIRQTPGLDNIFINDLHESNFMIDQDGNLKVLDLDSSKICDNKPFPAKYLMPKTLVRFTPKKYKIYNKFIDKTDDDYYDYKQELGYLDADENTDLFCYNIMLLNLLYGDNISRMDQDEFYSYMSYLKRIGVSNELINIFDKLLADCDNDSPYEYLDELTDEIIGRANHKVYELNK